MSTQKGINILRKGLIYMSRYRHEYKYVIDSKQEQILKMKVAAVMRLDKNVKDMRGYRITSLYFDDINNSCYYENESGTDPRSKFRVRYYNGDVSFLRLEKKSKRNGMTLKESCVITKEECKCLMKGEIPWIKNGMNTKKAKLFLEMKIRKMQPKVIVSYDRIPYVYSTGNVRVTFDKNLTASIDIEKFLTVDFAKRPIMQKGELVLEVKWDEILPKHIKEHIILDNLQWAAFSKYSLCRKYNLHGGLL